MAKIFIFSGTSEGRELSEYLCERQIENRVFVATEYGKVVMNSSEYATICQGRLDLDSMNSLFVEEKPDYVVDATHPYAIEVSKNIKAACENVGIENYIRVSRELPLTESLLREDYPDIEVVLSTEEAIQYLTKTQGNILLTTGVKTLSEYAKSSEIKDRLVARILPSKESLNLAYDAGLSPHQIVAMEGPFLASLNEAMIDQYYVKTLVTKNSGIKGGFIEKLEACKNKGIKALVIDIEKKKEGISLEEAKNLLANQLASACQKEVVKKQLTIVGIGVANDETVTVAAVEAIKKAELIIGAKRMLSYAKTINSSAKFMEAYLAEDVLKSCENANANNIVFAVSGDTGFFSGASKAADLLIKNGFDVKILPGISSISYFSSLINEPYSGGAIVSCHGREIDIVKTFRENNKLFTIVSDFSDVNRIVNVMKSFNASIFVGYNLGMENQLITKVDLDSFEDFSEEGLYIVGVIGNE